MSYTIENDSAFYAEVKKVVDSQADKAIASLEQEPDVHEAVHDARKRCKKIRAAWRLIRDDLGESAYKERNVWYRDAARLISDMRDATAVIESLNMLRDRFGDIIYKSAFDEVEAILQSRRAGYVPDDGSRPDLLKKVADRLRQAKEEINEIVLQDRGWDGVVHSLRRTYKRGYKAFRTLRDDPSSEGIHEWRKRSKYLRYELRLLKQVWPGMINPWRDELHELTDLQGDHHDLFEFKQTLDNISELDGIIPQTLKAVATQHQEWLFEKTLPLGQKLYAEEPDHFARRLYTYLEAWEQEPVEAVDIEVAFK